MNPEAPMDNLDDHWHEPPEQSPWWWLIVIVLVCVIMIGLILAFTWGDGALAHDHARPDLDRWFRQQYSTRGPCCDGEEAHHIADVDWDSTCADGKCHYRVRLYNKWWSVDDGAVVQGPNLSGTALVWSVTTRRDDDEVTSVFIRCFMPGAGG